MQGNSSPTRRRVLQITAAMCGSMLLPLRALAKGDDLAPVSWRGVALGAPAELTLYAADERVARDALRRATLEVRRLEAVFSLYQARSAISRLNRDGILHNPPLDLVRLISTAKGVSTVTGGAFDVTIQPLWTLYAGHFARQPDASEGPDSQELERTRALLDYRAVNVAANRIAFERPGMAVSLNGIAQGYITDRIAELLRRIGFENVLVNLGEIRGVGGHPSGRPWTVGIAAAQDSTRSKRTLEIADQAVATSAPMGTPFNTSGTAHHLFDPRTGTCAVHHQSVTVTAGTATLADAYSTAFAVMPWPDVRKVVRDQGRMKVDSRDTGGNWRSVSGILS